MPGSPHNSLDGQNFLKNFSKKKFRFGNDNFPIHSILVLYFPLRVGTSPVSRDRRPVRIRLGVFGGLGLSSPGSPNLNAFLLPPLKFLSVLPVHWAQPVFWLVGRRPVRIRAGVLCGGGQVSSPAPHCHPHNCSLKRLGLTVLRAAQPVQFRPGASAGSRSRAVSQRLDFSHNLSKFFGTSAVRWAQACLSVGVRFESGREYCGRHRASLTTGFPLITYNSL